MVMVMVYFGKKLLLARICFQRVSVHWSDIRARSH